jgi:hypothetical protein
LQYNAPYGVSDTNAPYINGNPATGTQGSIPPAASIEYPQREIVNFITKSVLTATNADLFQLAKAVQSGRVNYALDQGSPNQIAITPVVPIASYQVGQHFLIKMAYGNTSHVTVNISGVGNAPVIHLDQTPLNPWELTAGQLIEIAYDGANWQMISGGAVGGGAVTLTAPQHIYVNVNTGDDNLYDGTSATVGSGISGPFKTIQKALATMAKYNLGGWSFYIHVADGTYANSSPIDFPRPNGSGTVYLVGNATNPAACQIFNTGQGSCFRPQQGGTWSIDGFSYRATAAAPGDGGGGIWASNAAYINLVNSSWGPCPGTHFVCGPSASALLSGTHTITGGAVAHHHAYENGTLLNNTIGGGPSSYEPILNITAPVTMTQFVLATNGGQARPLWQSITGAANVTANKYNAVLNGVIDVQSRGASYLPGNAPGVTGSGGQYQ